MIRSKVWKIVWVSGIYIILIIILYLVVQYKVKWEHKDFNTYLYFYDCNETLCTSTSKIQNYYNKVKCDDNICPHIIDIISDNVILSREGKQWMYNYITNENVTNNYVDYASLSKNLILVTNESNKQGIIDLSGNIVISPEYEFIENYYNDILLYKENGTYKILNGEQLYDLDESFTKIVLINDKIFAGMQNNKFKIYSYDNIDNENNNVMYDYIYAYNDVILAISGKKIDLITTNMDSTLLMKINTFYEYTTEKERESLNIRVSDDIIFFNVFLNDSEYTTYKYSVSSKKII